MTYIFRTPVRMPEGPRLPSVPNPTTRFDGGREGFALMRHVNRGGGIPVAVLITGGVCTEVQFPNQTDLDAADQWFLGGRENVVDDATAAVLTTCGYGAHLILISYNLLTETGDTLTTETGDKIRWEAA